ncbi:DNA mismatch repair protein MutL, partial [Deinococcus sp. RL]|uniref:DNA mismatch repair endonuclease MutL n=1 Tax=Deinococcus sp. RL TaxID=1489678 RepID=UPI0004D8C64E
MPIQVLPPHVARLIAAGEVVSRPLDVVRELVDNALDAGASRIDIEVEAGGLSLIRVRDNGAGIPADAVALAPARHATSKLAPDTGAALRVTTLGFRGEALWAAAQAGELHLVTRPAAQVGAAEVTALGDEVTVRRTSAPAGTTVTVRNLFARLPARLRTQAPAAAEVRDITALVGRYVLHHPGLSWRLTVDGEARLTHAPADHRGAVASVYGPLSANRVLVVEAEGVRGVVSRPELTRARRDRMHFSVNGRPILAPPELERAVIEGFAALLPSGVAPLCVLDLSVAPEDHNPNVHPAKQVVALADLPGVAARVRAAVAGA